MMIATSIIIGTVLQPELLQLVPITRFVIEKRMLFSVRILFAFSSGGHLFLGVISARRGLLQNSSLLFVLHGSLTIMCRFWLQSSSGFRKLRATSTNAVGAEKLFIHYYAARVVDTAGAAIATAYNS